VKDSSGREVPGAGRLVAFMAVVVALGVAGIVYGLKKQPTDAPIIGLSVICLLSAGGFAVALGITQWRRRNLEPPADGGDATERAPSPRWQLPVPVQVFLVALWAAFLVVSVARERWLGVAADGLLLAASGFSLWRALHRRPAP
jgi:hypothetical protein